jgi:tRNA dimethylallyltransferase
LPVLLTAGYSVIVSSQTTPLEEEAPSAATQSRRAVQSGFDRATLAVQPLFLTGPTGSGKTELGVQLGERLGAEIISLDSMAIYRRMDIGTAKPSADDRRRVPHHLVDVLDPWEEFSLAEYLRAAAKAVGEIAARGSLALFVGGTPLYLKALLRGADSGPPPDFDFRARLEQEAATQGSPALHQRLAAVDPAAARRIHCNDRRRIVRALEVFEKTGIPITASQVHFHRAPNANARVICLELPRDELYRRIDQRVQSMFQRGLVEEVSGLQLLEHPLSRTARQAVGYKEVIEHLAGTRPLSETIELVQRRSRQFAKRQLTWFRSLSECQRVPIESVADSEFITKVLAVEP